jgi:hypothetical protein
MYLENLLNVAQEVAMRVASVQNARSSAVIFDDDDDASWRAANCIRPVRGRGGGDD